jgi:hypothetical protein
MMEKSLEYYTKEMNMSDEPQDKAGPKLASSATPKTTMPKSAQDKARRKSQTPTITDDLTGKFVRVGNKIYRTSDDKTPLVRLEPDRLKTSNIDALPDILRIAKANGWTSIKINGGDKFKKAAYLAAAAQGINVENYTPSKLTQAEAERLKARIVEREKARKNKTAPRQASEKTRDTKALKTLADRFLSQTHAQNARDPELRNAQSLVAFTISVARAKYPDNPAKASKEVEAKRQDVARRIGSGHSIAAIQVRNQKAQRVQERTQEKSISRDGRSR